MGGALALDAAWLFAAFLVLAVLAACGKQLVQFPLPVDASTADSSVGVGARPVDGAEVTARCYEVRVAWRFVRTNIASALPWYGSVKQTRKTTATSA